ncbi:MAG TPA: outer membrane beta-barrel protein [Steroidobacteraceae bacterium]
MTTDAPITRDSPNSFEFLIADQFAYDDNIYRLPSSFDVTSVAGPSATRADGFNSITLGGNGRWFSDIQAVSLNFRADDNRFIHNDSLDNVSGKGNLAWDWRLGSYWAGQAGVNYYRALANPANTGYYARDVVQREDYFGTVRLQLGPQWALYGGFIGANTTQTAVPEQPFDFRSKAGNAGIEFATSSSNTVSLDYRYTSAIFPQEFVLVGAPFNSDYNEQTARILVKYVFSAATELDVSGGYLKRDYPESRFASFSGDIWRAALQWEPTDQLQWILTGWRQLAAYIDAESDYFVSKGVSLTPTWIATQTLKLSLTVSRENHDYIGSSPSTITLASRSDKLTSVQGGLIYAPKDTLLFNLTARYDKRDSNQAQFQFNDTLATASVTYKIRP